MQLANKPKETREIPSMDMEGKGSMPNGAKRQQQWKKTRRRWCWRFLILCASATAIVRSYFFGNQSASIARLRSDDERRRTRPAEEAEEKVDLPNKILPTTATATKTTTISSSGEASKPADNYHDDDIRSIYEASTLKQQIMSSSSSSSLLQPWIIQYLQWHIEMRQQYPGMQLIDHPDAPKLLIKVCIGRVHGPQHKCDGLNDRMNPQFLPNILYAAFKTKRLLLYKWLSPYALEEFLQPNVIDWTVPPTKNSTVIPTLHQPQYLISKLISNIQQQQPQKKAYKNSFVRLQEDPLLLNEKVVTITFGSDMIRSIKKERSAAAALEELNNTTKEQHDETTTATEADASSEFGLLWHLFFKPSPPIENEILNIMTTNNLKPHQYIATHLRINHPSRRSFLEPQEESQMISKTNGKKGQEAVDAFGLAFEGASREMMINVATHAIDCSKLLLISRRRDNSNERTESSDEPIYFFSDSDDLVQYVVQNHSPGAATTTKIVSRDVTKKRNLHLDFDYSDDDLDLDVSNFYGTFVDLYLAIGARCVSYGIGNYAILATKISNTNCLQTHERLSSPKIARQWGSNPYYPPNVMNCPLPMTTT